MADVIMEAAPIAEAGPSRRDQLVDTFTSYRQQLDLENERRERLIILSRSITQQSKKVIFHLHRCATLPGTPAFDKNIQTARTMVQKIVESFAQVSAELRDTSDAESYWRWYRNISPGLEEFIESISFLHYLEHRQLITCQEIQNTLKEEGPDDTLVVVTPDDFILGISDLTGELMRFATNALSTGDAETPQEICAFVRNIKTYFDGIPTHHLRQLSKKQEETTRSLMKIEKLCYETQLRSIEYDGRRDVLAQMSRRDVEGYRDQPIEV
ncbi:Translin [Kockovaella imperatae]|uniref:Translin n=1 Tax=Kockovaella imperatae TaxID=4999 RepID=A0A1Y1UMF2_9TREE|nr:Translin [Kockovaella imperatae]ORX39189.1 Translin [Kockovaella imperatae]